MFEMVSLEPVDYLVIGHITVDLTPAGPALGGSAVYSALTARALGLRAGIVTARGNEIPLNALEGIPVVCGEAPASTTFENLYTPGGRVQYIRQVAPAINLDIVPEAWRRARIIHLAPVAQEVPVRLPSGFRPALLGLTPQGWMRAWDKTGLVYPCAWPEAENALREAGAVVFSVEDVGGDEERIEQYAHFGRLLAVTEGIAGARVFWHGDSRRFRAPKVDEVDATGAGDVFAAAFFIRLLETRDPWEAARFANRVAAISVTRPGIQGIPTASEIQACLMEVLD
ncbi:MAG: PfkB family carbohydrate kinase [Anaerolineales bacterium]|nr:PfkB family carbohydrate kinase [Anaerolineales bacterium]